MNDNYDTELERIQARNDFILGHFVHTWRGRVSDDTLYQHALNREPITRGISGPYGKVGRTVESHSPTILEGI